jgi:protein phosphatase
MSFFTRKKPSVTVHVFAKTDTGQQRDHNEDSFLVADLTAKNASLKPEVREHVLGPKGTLLIVADGMGGAAAGEVASDMAAKHVYNHLVETWTSEKDNSPQQFAFRLREAIEGANTKIHERARQNTELRGMGTTATAVGILDDFLYLTQIGDSRAYLIRNGEAAQITKDQSLMQRLVDAGELTEEEAERSERRNIILQALGPDPNVRVDLTHQRVCRGDMIVVCSDGLSGQVTREEIGAAATQEDDLVKVCGALVDLANARGGPDNITVIVARVDGSGLAEPGETTDDVGHQVYPLLDTESTTEPVPVYKGSPPPDSKRDRSHMLIAAFASAVILILSLLIAG